MKFFNEKNMRDARGRRTGISVSIFSTSGDDSATKSVAMLVQDNDVIKGIHTIEVAFRHSRNDIVGPPETKKLAFSADHAGRDHGHVFPVAEGGKIIFDALILHGEQDENEFCRTIRFRQNRPTPEP